MRRRHLTFAQRREYRRMMRLLRELDPEDAGLTTRGSRVRGAARKLFAVAGIAVLATGFTLVVAHKIWGVTVTPDGFKTPQRLGKPPEVATAVGTFVFLQTQPGDPTRPVAYDPCRPIQYEVNDTLAPPGTAAVVRDAVTHISHATGLQFEYVGVTSRLPQRNEQTLRSARQPALIAWTTPEVVPQLGGRTAGIGGSTPAKDDFSGDLEYVTGTVALDAPDLREVMARPGGAGQVRAVVMHELGHLVGLGHVSDAAELMYDDNVGLLHLGPGDREGLAQLGSGRCYH